MYQDMGEKKRKQPEKCAPNILIVQFLLALLGACKIQFTSRGTLPSPVLHTSTHGCPHNVVITAMQVWQTPVCSQGTGIAFVQIERPSLLLGDFTVTV